MMPRALSVSRRQMPSFALSKTMDRLLPLVGVLVLFGCWWLYFAGV
ncbi:hypothetical protein J5X98_16260 [Leptothermofonsia sichuanensis E412]|nr:hypothetical protein [Leptothermofonsia sichuanensis]QZZ18983.1 hypothetical protein J5X98_16260 [Leptothermofonsia sichuanensis E412]